MQESMGPIVDRSREHLASLCDNIMSDHRLREEVISEMKSNIAAKLNFARLFRDMIDKTLSSGTP